MIVKKTQMSLALSVELKNRLDSYAKAEEQNVAGIVRKLIKDMLDQNTPKQAAKTKEPPATLPIVTARFIAIIEDNPNITPNELWPAYKAIHGKLDDSMYSPAVKAAWKAIRPVKVEDDYQPVKAEIDPFG